MKLLLRFLAWALAEIIWFCIALCISALGVYFAYGVAGGEFSYNVTVAIIIAIAVGAIVASKIVVHAVYNRNIKVPSDEEGENP
jgi:hypothetical protein